MAKGKYSQQVITKELWKEFREKYPEYKDKKDVELAKLWADIAYTIREEVVTNPLGVKLGSYTGELKLQYLPHKFESPDHVGSAEVGYKIPHKSIVSKGKVGKVKWERRWAVKFNKVLQFFAFKGTREITKRAGEYIDKTPERLRISRNTLGGYSIWRQLKKNYDK